LYAYLEKGEENVMQKIRKVFAKVVAGLLIVSNLAIAAPSMTYAASATSFTTYGGWNEMMYATIKGCRCYCSIIFRSS
jgi:hypothetical protein